ncbi:MAG: poly-gamma-glutamate system protein [Deferribacteraceae bacterium]|nr:poly-gamma-glutamate system protein [Deferribacteraceae bacterium]
MLKKLLCIIGLLLVGCASLIVQPASSIISEKREAVELAAEARAMIGERLLGEEYTFSTTSLGSEAAKRLSHAPDFPALIVQWLKEGGIEAGDSVAINASGSFPALNIAALSAVKAVGAKPLLISSLGSSSWGANRPDFTWLHMEQILIKRWPEYKSLAVSLGGGRDMATGLFEEGEQALYAALKLTDAPVLTPIVPEDIYANRMLVWRKANGGVLPKMLINVGGNPAYWGSKNRNDGELRDEGFITPDMLVAGRNGVGDRFLAEGRPIIHLLNITPIAAQYKITIPPDVSSPIWQPQNTAPADMHIKR